MATQFKKSKILDNSDTSQKLQRFTLIKSIDGLISKETGHNTVSYGMMKRGEVYGWEIKVTRTKISTKKGDFQFSGIMVNSILSYSEAKSFWDSFKAEFEEDYEKYKKNQNLIENVRKKFNECVFDIKNRFCNIGSFKQKI